MVQIKEPDDAHPGHTSHIRLFTAHPLAPAATVKLDPMQSNYAVNVMRKARGDELLVFNGRDGEWLANIAEARRGAAVLTVERQTCPQVDGPDIHYLFAPLKHAKTDYIAQKATEMGAAVLQPVMTHRTIAGRVNGERMRANAIEAAEQCGILRVPETREPVKLDKLLDTWDTARIIIYCDEAAPIASPIAALSAIPRGPLALLIGPEGGFDPAERQRLRSLEFVHAISLGPRIMRADTAAVAALALVNAVLGDWG
jgi:16S rRNA (uracil1498-N3)-methyltransferase